MAARIDDLLLLRPADVPVRKLEPLRQATRTINIWHHRTGDREVVGKWPGDLSMKQWAALIDRGLAGYKRSAGYKRPLHDPEAESMVPVPGWTAGEYHGPFYRDTCKDCPS